MQTFWSHPRLTKLVSLNFGVGQKVHSSFSPCKVALVVFSLTSFETILLDCIVTTVISVCT